MNKATRRCIASAFCVLAVFTHALLSTPASAFDFKAAADGPELVAPEGGKYETAHICDMIRITADYYGLPREYFARLIWKESRFDIKALSPVGAQGIAQFMPGTAKIRGLKDPWDPVQALPASASFLSDLKAQFGNFGLAAAAYNGGPNRVARWLVKKSRLPTETVKLRAVDHASAGRVVSPERPEGRIQAAGEGQNLRRGLPGTADHRHPCHGRCGARALGCADRRWNHARRRAARVQPGTAQGVQGHRRTQCDPGALTAWSGAERLYSARVGAGSRTAARKLCGRIRRTGVSCLVRRN